MKNGITITFEGEKHSVSEWCRLFGTTRAFFDRRVKEGMAVDAIMREWKAYSERGRRKKKKKQPIPSAPPLPATEEQRALRRFAGMVGRLAQMTEMPVSDRLQVIELLCQDAVTVPGVSDVK